jgi:hypothetical protein
MKMKIAFALILVALSTSVFAERPDEVVLLIDMQYSDGRWEAAPFALLPCAGPSKPDALSGARSMYLLRGRDGNVLLQRYIDNPRIILIEDPREGSALLEQIHFRLRIGIPQQYASARFKPSDVRAFEFYENGHDVRYASAVVTFEEQGLAAMPMPDRAPCSVMLPDFSKRRPLPRDSGDAISPSTLATLLRHDRGAVIRWGIESRVTPTELKRLLTRNEGIVAGLQLNAPQMELLLAEYTRAFGRKYR